jgi:hypothetical protein
MRIKYEKISIGTRINNRIKGHSGTKIHKKFTLCCIKPIIKKDTQKVVDKKSVKKI